MTSPSRGGMIDYVSFGSNDDDGQGNSFFAVTKTPKPSFASTRLALKFDGVGLGSRTGLGSLEFIR